MLGRTRAELDAALQEAIAAGEKLKAEKLAKQKAKMTRQKQAETKSPDRKRISLLRCRYGLTAEDYQSLIDQQQGLCAICKRIMVGMCIDHDHITGKVRGLLCRKCNVAIGFLDEDIKLLEACIAYITKHKS